MTSKISSELKNKYYFLQLDDAARKEVTRQVQSDYKACEKKDFINYCTAALSVVNNKQQEDNLPPKAKEILDALNRRAQELIKVKRVKPWQDEFRTINDLTFYLQKGAQASLISGVLPAGMAFFYFRSHKVLALASGCAVCALLVFHSLFNKLSVGFNVHAEIIDALEVKNLDQFSGQVDGVYEELKKTSYLMRFYFNAHESRMSQEHRGLQLLKEQLSAIHCIQILMEQLATSSMVLAMNRMFPSALPSDPNTEKPVNLNEITTFFQKFEKLCRKWRYGIVGMGVLALAWTYYAYVQKAYLMTVAGMVTFLGSMVISRQLSILQRGSKKIYSLKEGDQINSAFREMVSKSLLLKLLALKGASNSQIQEAVVIPFDAILKLIPSWKDPVTRPSSPQKDPVTPA